MKVWLVALAVSCGVMMTAAARAEVRLPHVISDHAVLQRNQPIHIWGWSTPNAHVTARFHEQSVAAVANPLGEWSLWLGPETAGGPYTLTVSGDGPEVTANDLLVGDVWVASGQSNMEMPLDGFPGSAVLKDAAQEIAAATNPKLRLLLVEHKASIFRRTMSRTPGQHVRRRRRGNFRRWRTSSAARLRRRRTCRGG